jgi:hypothetical protein
MEIGSHMIRLIAAALVWMVLLPASHGVRAQAGDPVAAITSCDADQAALPTLDGGPSAALLSAPIDATPAVACDSVDDPLRRAIAPVLSLPRGVRLLC